MPFLLALVLLASSLGFSACSACDCGPSGVRVNVPPATRGHVVSMRLSGSACDGVEPECFDESYLRTSMDKCTLFEAHPARGGACRFDADLDDGSTFTTTFELAAHDGCCGGPSPIDGQRERDMPALAVMRDAGVD